jgi:hypothetical protein
MADFSGRGTRGGDADRDLGGAASKAAKFRGKIRPIGWVMRYRNSTGRSDVCRSNILLVVLGAGSVRMAEHFPVSFPVREI